MHFTINVTTITSCNSKVSAVNVLLTTLLNFLDCQVSGIYFPFDPSINRIILPCEPPHFKLPKDASLKQINAALSIASILGNNNTASVDFNSLDQLFSLAAEFPWVTIHGLSEWDCQLEHSEFILYNLFDVFRFHFFFWSICNPR